MYCPQCGQQQISVEVRFCSRCGFPLNTVGEILAGGGALPATASGAKGSQKLSPRQRGVRQGAMLMLSVMLVVPLVIFVLVELMNAPEELIPLAAITCVIGGLLRILYALFFEEKYAPVASQNFVPPYVPPSIPAQMSRPQQNASLQPPQQGTQVPSFMPARRPDTAELATPPSVTDHTTRLLRDEPDKDAR